ncbi:MAG: undecaprenyldiphospho-muramoylpentapeptide beta-N-acetylglucosaminyltransferase [Candidatus Sericytochromatia bacterium]|nr:undecaprenyldiphospho-muramoylpentapeptide beta-N-acetylglucosaminyltransferase [Candidatus Sericytochromatia bacterium]
MADVVLTGGGTGGHVYPALAVAEALVRLRPGLDVLFVGTPDRMEARVVPAAGWRFEAIEARGLSSRPLEAVKAVATLARGLGQARDLMRRETPRVVLGTGGFASAPTLLAARLEGVPTYLHEQNVVPGKVNRWLGRWATGVLLSLPGGEHWWSGVECIFTGNPIRQTAFQVERSVARAAVKVPEGAPLLLVTGGSQGARRINDAMLDLAPRLLRETRWHVLHVTGPAGFEDARLRLPAEAEGRWTLVPYMDDMPTAVVACDIAVGRAGATTLAELTAMGKGMVLVPYPFAGGHQLLNARAALDAGAARVITDHACDGPGLADVLLPLLTDPEAVDQMAAASLRLGSPNAADQVARLLLDAAFPLSNAGA